MVFILSKAACGCLLSPRSSLLLSVCLQGVPGCDFVLGSCSVILPASSLNRALCCLSCLLLLLFVSRVNMTCRKGMNCHRGNVIDICFCPIIPRLNLIFASVFMFEQRVGSVKIASMFFFPAVLLKSCHTSTCNSWPSRAGVEYRAIIYLLISRYCTKDTNNK